MSAHWKWKPIHLLCHRNTELMRTVRNITVSVTPEIYRETRMLAAEYDTTVFSIVAGLLIKLRHILKASGYPVAVRKALLAEEKAKSARLAAKPAAPPTPSPEKNPNPHCEAVKPNPNLSDSNAC